MTTSHERSSRAARSVALLGAGALVAGTLGFAAAAPASADVRDLEAACAGVNLDPFADVDGLPAATQDAVSCLFGHGITQGRSQDVYAPQDRVSRQEMAIFLTRQIGYVLASSDLEPDLEITEAPFTDRAQLTPEGQDAVDLLWSAGITTGFTDNTYRGGADISRAEMASLVNRVQNLIAELAGIDGYDPDDSDADFPDVNRTTHAGPDIYALEGVGIVQGATSGRYNPAAPVLRRDMAFFITRHLDENIAAGRVDALIASSLSVAHNNDGESSLVPTVIEGAEYGGVARFASVVAGLRADAADDRGFLLLNSGDNYLAGASLNASREEGAPFYDALAVDYLDYDALAIGNHEFDFGPEFLARFITNVPDTPFVSANLDVSGEPSLAALDDRIVPSVVVEDGGQTVGVIGLTTPLLPTISSPGGVVVDDAVVEIAQEQIDALTADGVDVIVIQSHLQGIDEELALVEELSGVDAVIGGGGAELLARPGDPLVPGDVRADDYPLVSVDADGFPVPVVTTLGNWNYVGQLTVNLDVDGNVVGYAEADSGVYRVTDTGDDAVEPDATLLADVEAPVQAYLDALDANVLADNQVNLDFQTPDVRGGESNGGNLMADMMFATAAKQAEAFDAPAPQVAFHNGGGIRGNVDQAVGPFSEADTFRIAAFSNFVSVAPAMTVAELKAVLETGAKSLPADGDGAFVQISGASYTIDLSEPARQFEGDTRTVLVEGSRIQSLALDDGTDLIVDGEIVFDGTLAVASNDFSLDGGDRYPQVDFIRLGVQYQQGLADYLTDDLEGVVTAEAYPAEGEGRITIVPATP